MRDKTVIKRQKLSRSLLQEEIGNIGILKGILLFLTLIIVFFVFWSISVPLNEVITVQGVIQPSSQVAAVQHSRGGEIQELFIQERSWVDAGDPLIRFDDELILNQIQETETQLFYLRQQRDLLLEELEILDKLYIEKLTSTSEYLDLQRKVLKVKGEINIGLKRLERYNLLLQDTVLYAPIAGYVHGLGDWVVGSVVKAAEEVFSIVPDDIRYIAEVRIPATRMGSIRMGQSVILKFSAYDFARFGGMDGTLDAISPTTFVDERNQSYFQGIINIPRNQLGNREEDLTLSQGMTLSADIRTGGKTLFQYLFLPVKASRQAAFQEP